MTSKEKDLTIKLLEAKLERLSGKKIVYENIEKPAAKQEVKENKEALEENVFVDLYQQFMSLANDPTTVSVGGEMVSKGAAFLAMLGTIVGLPLAAVATSWIQSLLKKAGGDRKKVATAIKNTPKGADVEKTLDSMNAGAGKTAVTTTK